MTQEIIELNKEIAKMMGYKYYPYNFEGTIPSGIPGYQKEKAHFKLIPDSYLCRNHNQLPFDKDWNWLMKAVEFIRDLGYNIGVSINNGEQSECLISGVGIEKSNRILLTFEHPESIYATFFCVCKFAKMFNENKL